MKAWESVEGNERGLALFVMADDRKLRFEVGYGIEGSVPDMPPVELLEKSSPSNPIR